MSVGEEIKELDQQAIDVASRNGRVTKPCVLLVEDDKALRRYLEVTLDRAGYEVMTAADGLEAMKLVLASSIDIVVTDAMMPNLSGQEFCRFLRNSRHFTHIPIVILSGSKPSEVSGEVELADAFLSKPISVEELTNCLERLLPAAR